jgi:hypothetical protein
MMESRFAAFGIARGTIALAVYSGQELECWKIRMLPNDTEKARGTATAFARWAGETFRPRAAGFESGGLGSLRKEALRTEMYSVFRNEGIPIMAATESDLFASFRSRPLRRRGDLRRIIATILPQIQVHRSQLPLLDAAALGLLLETNHILAINHPDE